MKTQSYKISMVFTLLFMMGITAFGQYNMLYIGAAEADSPVDSMIIDFLTTEGYRITFRGDKTFETNFTEVDSFKAYDVIYISEVVSSGRIANFKKAEFPLPSVIMEGFAPKAGRWGMTATDDSTTWHQLAAWDDHTDADKWVVTDNEHYITKIYEVDDEIVWTTKPELAELGVTGFDLLDVAGAIPLMNNMAEKFELLDLPTLWAIPAGSFYSSYLPEDAGAGLDIRFNMVMSGAIATGLGEFATEEFYTVLKRSLEWVTENEEEDVAINEKSQIVDVLVGPNPTKGIVNISLKLPSSVSTVINIYDIAGKEVETFDMGNLNAGNNNLEINLSTLPNTYYMYEIQAGEFVHKGKICINQ